MAQGQIRITPEMMRVRAGQYTGQGEKLREIIVNMDGLLSELQEEWEGAASAAYAQKYAELRPQFESAGQLIDSIASALMQTAATVEETDLQIAGRFSS